MNSLDIIVTPAYLLLIYVLAFIIRPYVATSAQRGYFILALSLKLFGAICVGLVYYFHYKGGDTINYFDHGSKWIWQAFVDNPINGFRLIFGPQDYAIDLQPYYRHIWFYKDPVSYVVVRFSGFFSLFTFHVYTPTAFCFALLGFSGSWAMYKALLMRYPGTERLFAWSIFFIPSLFFWGSGILKDTLAMAGLGWMLYGAVHMLYGRGGKITSLLAIFLGGLLTTSVKPYILVCFTPALGLWFFLHLTGKIRSFYIRILLRPVGMVVAIVLSTYVLSLLGSSHDRYAVDNLVKTSQSVAQDIYFLSGRNSGSRYYLDGYDGSPAGMLKVLPQAINVSLFRPYLWEVNNPFMLLAALESFSLLLATLYILFRLIKGNNGLLKDHFWLLLIVFSLAFSFAIGVSTFNFGSLVRYRIPVLPCYAAALTIAYKKLNGK